ncbi:hypothetical protein [Novosphingobium humi]|uniref:BON domain-containing protein n=1 Tax=Novosphingobium humi TaxID=2282397 RepID=A0ABY7U3N5_9SPHN|nr:hypothetical protein [Novosphingobium humi]WCT78894.1 hypothetical protein PQ457_08030 [Novosphingobium humi]
MTVARRRAWAIVRAMAAEIQRQASEGTLSHAGRLDLTGHIELTGTLDLASLANAAERGLRQEFNL